jgi:glycosyltransferase involved in cell wall biosynthesis
MKIGVITSAYPEFEDDPHGIFVHRLMREIVKDEHDVQVIAPHTGGDNNFYLDGVRVEKFHYFYPKKYEKLAGRSGMIDNVKEGFLVKFEFLTFLLFNLYYSLKMFRDKDIVHVQWPIPNGLGAYFLKKIYKIPYINTIYGEEVYLAKRYHMGWILKLLVNNSTKTLAISSATLSACHDIGLDPKKLQIIPFGVDTTFFRPLNIPPKDEFFNILSVGYLIERKGHEYLIRAINEIHEERDDIRLQIIGSGPLKNKLENLINDLGLDEKIKMVGNVSDEELLQYYNSSDLFILPAIIDSQGNTEGLGVVLLEAMACRIPVIGSNIGGITDIINNAENGLLVPEKDIYQLSQSILLLMEKNKFRLKLAAQGYEDVKHKFSWQIIAKKYIKIYSKIKL